MVGTVTIRRWFASLAPFVVATTTLAVVWHGSVVSASPAHGNMEHRVRSLNFDGGQEGGYPNITVCLSAWHQNSSDISYLLGPIKEAIDSFLCEETDFIVLDINYKTVCIPSSGTTNSVPSAGGNITSVSGHSGSFAEFLAKFDHENTYVSNEPTNIVVSTGQGGGVDWTSWKLTYEVIQIGELFMEQANTVNISDAGLYMQDVTQLGLDVCIMEGEMGTMLNGTGIVISRVGDEIQTFAVAASGTTAPEKDDVVGVTTDADIESMAVILRYIGACMLVFTVAAVLVLTWLARKHRLATEQAQKAQDKQLAESKGLVTEQGVNLMLDLGRKASERVWTGTSSDFKNASSKSGKDRSDGPELTSVPLGETSLTGDNAADEEQGSRWQVRYVES